MEHEVEIIELLTPYMMAFPNSKMNAGSLLVYARALSSLSIAEIDAAMLKLMLTAKFFPRVAEIFEQAENVSVFAIGTTQKSADEAWHEVMCEVHNAFIYRKPKFSTAVIEKAALNMGWTSLCNLETDAINTARAQFMKIYNSVIEREKDKKINTDVVKLLPSCRVSELLGETVNKLSSEIITFTGKSQRQESV